MRDCVSAQAVPTWWPSPGMDCCSARCKNCQYKTIYLFSDRIYGITAQTALLKCLSLCEAAPLCASDFRPVICYPVGLWQNLITFSQQPCRYKKSKYAQVSIITLLNVNENSLISVLTQCLPVISFQNDCWVVSGLNCYFIIVPKIVSIPRGTTGHCSVTNHKSSSNKYIQIQKEQREKKQKHWRFQDVDLRMFLRC